MSKVSHDSAGVVPVAGRIRSAISDLATVTLAHEEHLDDVVAGCGGDIEIDVIRACWSLRSLMEIRWLVEHRYGAVAPCPDVAVLNSLSASS